MPELPEVETLVVQLNRLLQGRRISKIEIRNTSILQTPPLEFEDKILGKEIEQVARRGKYIRMSLYPDLVLWFHLGMTGQLFLGSPRALSPHTHFIFSFFDSTRQLLYRDVRRFGRIELTPADENEAPEGVKKLGLEPEAWKPQDLVSLFKKRQGRIKSLLLDQRSVAGLGNIYADESLHRAGIHPLRRARGISCAKLGLLHQAMCEVLEEAIRWGGSSIDDFIHVDGTRGKFQEFHRVYGRAGKKCFNCGTLIRAVKISGRTSSFCPYCQR